MAKIYMKDNLKMIKEKDLENILKKILEIFILVNGKMIKKKVKVNYIKKTGKLFMKVNLILMKLMEMGNIIMIMVIIILGNL